jgi:hypothetical protein
MEGVSTYDMNRVRRINIWYEQGVYMWSATFSTLHGEHFWDGGVKLLDIVGDINIIYEQGKKFVRYEQGV